MGFRISHRGLLFFYIKIQFCFFVKRYIVLLLRGGAHINSLLPLCTVASVYTKQGQGPQRLRGPLTRSASRRRRRLLAGAWVSHGCARSIGRAGRGEFTIVEAFRLSFCPFVRGYIGTRVAPLIDPLLGYLACASVCCPSFSRN